MSIYLLNLSSASAINTTDMGINLGAITTPQPKAAKTVVVNTTGTKIGQIASPAASHTVVVNITGTKIGQIASPAASHT